MTDHTYWQKQTPDKPLFPDLIWSRPQNKRTAGKLLIVGGNAHSFAAVADAYRYATKAGIGSCRVVLPDSLEKTVGRLFPEAEFAPSTPSGSFARAALAVILDAAAWADGVLLAGDFGRNSETAIAIEQFISKYTGQLTITNDALDYAVKVPAVITRPGTLLVCSFGQLQKLAGLAHFTRAFTSEMDFLHLIDALHEFTKGRNLITKRQDSVFVAIDGLVCTSKLDDEIWRVKTASKAAVWWLQNPNKTFAALCSSLVI